MRLFAFFAEIIPLMTFFIGYELFGLIPAALLSVLVGAGVMAFAWMNTRRIAAFPAYSIGLAGIFTFIAFAADAEVFIKLQPTVFNGVFGAILLAGWMRKLAVMKVFFGTQFDLNEETWMTLSFRWGVFFICLAALNEAAWRGLDDDGWVMVKTFVFAPLSAGFMLAQLPITLKGRVK